MTTQTKANPIDQTLTVPGATTLDEVLRRAPGTVTDADLDIIIAHSREERTRFQIKGEERADREEGIEDLGPIDFGPPEETDDRQA